MLILKSTANVTTEPNQSDMPPKMFLTTVLKRLGEGWLLLILISKLFWFPMLSGVTIATSLSESTQDFLELSFHMFPYNEIFKVFKNNI